MSRMHLPIEFIVPQRSSVHAWARTIESKQAVIDAMLASVSHKYAIVLIAVGTTIEWHLNGCPAAVFYTNSDGASVRDATELNPVAKTLLPILLTEFRAKVMECKAKADAISDDSEDTPASTAVESDEELVAEIDRLRKKAASLRRLVIRITITLGGTIGWLLA